LEENKKHGSFRDRGRANKPKSEDISIDENMGITCGGWEGEGSKK